MNTKGFIHLLLIPVIFLLIGGYFIFNKGSLNKIVTVGSPVASESTSLTDNPSPVSSSSAAPKKTATSTPKPTTIANPYNLTVASGALKVLVKATSGNLIGDQIIELKTLGGYKVLVNNSTDIQTMIAKQGSNEVIFSSVPQGPYAVRAKYKDQWGSSYNVIVNSGKQAYLEVYVTGDTQTAAPTPTATPGPTCSINSTNTSYGGPAPLTITFAYGASYHSSSNYVTGVQWDVQGDGGWDTDFGYNPNITHTYNTAGRYDVKMQVKLLDGSTSPVCTKPISVY